MKNSALRLVGTAALMAYTLSATAVTVSFTASFSPSIESPENNIFTNTTTQSGFCTLWMSICSDGLFSVSVGLTGKMVKAGIYKNAAARDSMYFGMPGAWRSFTVTNMSGAKATVQFRVSAFSARYNHKRGFYPSWSGGGFHFAGEPCTGTNSSTGTAFSYSFMWKLPTLPGDVACYKTVTEDYFSMISIDAFSIGYELKTPNPLQMESGIYTGTLKLSAGPGGDFDFGDNFTVNDSNVYFAFTLSVTHELKLNITEGDQKVSLQPCASGTTCTKEKGAANWERWMVTRITPELTGRSTFKLSSSGAFMVYLECEQQSGKDCALKSDNTPSQMVPVQTLLTLPGNIVDSSTSATVKKRRLAVGRDLTKNVFLTKRFDKNKAGSIDFLVRKKDVDTMLKTRPDTYRGAVTVIFDPKIY